MNLLERITQLCACHGPAGDEEEVRESLRAAATPYADEITVDAMGNLIVRRRGPGPRRMVCAHLDTVGLMVTRAEKEGFLRVGAVGGLNPKEVVYTPVRFRSGVRGVLGKDEKAEFSKLETGELLLDVGAKDREEALALVKPGDTAVFDLPVRALGANRVAGPYLDNRLSCAVLLAALERLGNPAGDLYFVFSVQEELGLRGAKTAAFSVDPAVALSVDVTTADDVPGSSHAGTAKLGAGAAVKVMDRSVLCHRSVVEGLEALAADRGIPAQREIMTDGGTDAGAIHTTRGGVVTGGISIPCRYLHTPAEVADLTDAEAAAALLTAWAQTQWTEGLA